MGDRETFAAADAAFETDDVRRTAEQILRAFGDLLEHPEALVPGYDDVITLFALRAALPEIPRDLMDAALRHLDHHLMAEVSEADDPTEEDKLAAVWTTWGPDDDEQGWQHHFGLITSEEEV
jgi:hypothetical protein